MTRWLAGVLALLLAATLAGCGSRTEDYCDALRSDRARIDAMVASGGDALLTGLPVLQDLAGQAPDDLTDEWQTFVNAVEGLRDALAQARVSPARFRDGRIPASVSRADRRAIRDAADTLSSPEVVDAVQGIETQARDVCKVNLGL